MAKSTNGEEKPLKHNAVFVCVIDGVEPKLVILVVVLSKVKKDSRRFEDDKVVSGVVDKNWDTSVGVQLQVPRFLFTLARCKRRVSVTSKKRGEERTLCRVFQMSMWSTLGTMLSEWCLEV
jgi:hypothetical protein